MWKAQMSQELTQNYILLLEIWDHLLRRLEVFEDQYATTTKMVT